MFFRTFSSFNGTGADPESSWDSERSSPASLPLLECCRKQLLLLLRLNPEHTATLRQAQGYCSIYRRSGAFSNFSDVFRAVRFRNVPVEVRTPRCQGHRCLHVNQNTKVPSRSREGQGCGRPFRTRSVLRSTCLSFGTVESENRIFPKDLDPQDECTPGGRDGRVTSQPFTELSSRSVRTRLRFPPGLVCGYEICFASVIVRFYTQKLHSSPE